MSLIMCRIGCKWKVVLFLSLNGGERFIHFSWHSAEKFSLFDFLALNNAFIIVSRINGEMSVRD
jgi:hypothetical protein